MAIELKEKQEDQTIGKKIVFAISLLLLICSAAGYAYLKYYALIRTETTIKELSTAINSQKSSDLVQMESNAIQIEKMVNDFKVLFTERPKTSNFFLNFETWAQPQITYSNFSLNSDSRLVTMKGSTSYFGPIVQQIDILKNQTLVEGYLISNVKLAEAGGVTFDLSLTLKPELFK
jgi:hypothetical protein